MVWLCGVHGFREKWRAVLGDSATGEVRLLDLPLDRLLELPERPAIVAVDVPIGLPEVILPVNGATTRLLLEDPVGARSCG